MKVLFSFCLVLQHFRLDKINATRKKIKSKVNRKTLFLISKAATADQGPAAFVRTTVQVGHQRSHPNCHQSSSISLNRSTECQWFGRHWTQKSRKAANLSAALSEDFNSKVFPAERRSAPPISIRPGESRSEWRLPVGTAAQRKERCCGIAAVQDHWNLQRHSMYWRLAVVYANSTHFAFIVTHK